MGISLKTPKWPVSTGKKRSTPCSSEGNPSRNHRQVPAQPMRMATIKTQRPLPRKHVLVRLRRNWKPVQCRAEQLGRFSKYSTQDARRTWSLHVWAHEGCPLCLALWGRVLSGHPHTHSENGKRGILVVPKRSSSPAHDSQDGEVTPNMDDWAEYTGDCYSASTRKCGHTTRRGRTRTTLGEISQIRQTPKGKRSDRSYTRGPGQSVRGRKQMEVARGPWPVARDPGPGWGGWDPRQGRQDGMGVRGGPES